MGNTIIFILMILILIFGLIFSLIKRKKNIDRFLKKSKHSAINLKKEISVDKTNENDCSKKIKSINISSKTEREILRKLEIFERKNDFIKKDINLSSLSKQFGTNNKYLSEVIKNHRQKQFNNYLNELRINYIVNRILSEPKYIDTKIIYLASDCGYTSHSTFTTIFTQIMQDSPSNYIKKIKNNIN